MKKIYSLVAIFTFIVILTPSSLSYGSFIKVNKNGFGPCLINGVVGNGNLTVGLDKKGTIVLFSWPKASYYDHVDYLALSDKQPNYGVKDNMGLFTGIIFQKDNIRDISWLKSEDWNHTQYYLNDDSNILITESVNEKLKLKVQKRLDRIKIIRDRRNSAFFKFHLLQEKISFAEDENEKLELKEEISKIREKIYKMNKTISKAPTRPTHKDIADILGIPRGSIDSGIHYIKSSFKEIDKKSA